MTKKKKKIAVKSKPPPAKIKENEFTTNTDSIEESTRGSEDTSNTTKDLHAMTRLGQRFTGTVSTESNVV